MPAKLTYHQSPKWRSKSDSDRNKRYGRQWRKVRAAVLRARPLCVDCEAAGRVRPAAEGHHIIKAVDRPDLVLDPENVMPLCEECHDVRNARGE